MPEKSLVTMITTENYEIKIRESKEKKEPDSERDRFYICNRLDAGLVETLRDKTFGEMIPYFTKLPLNPTSEQVNIKDLIDGFMESDESREYMAIFSGGEHRGFNVMQIKCKDPDDKLIYNPDRSRPFAMKDDNFRPYVSEISVEGKIVDQMEMTLALRFLNA